MVKQTVNRKAGGDMALGQRATAVQRRGSGNYVIAIISAGLLILLLVLSWFIPGLSSQSSLILRVLISISAGGVSLVLTGGLTIGGKISGMAVKATGPFAVAAAVFYLLIPAPPPPGRPDLSLPGEVVNAYLDMVSAYNKGQSEAYYASYDSPMRCFYAEGSAVGAPAKRGIGGKLFVRSEDLRALRVDRDEVEFCDSGSYQQPNASSRLSHRKTIVMVRRSGGWKVTVEVGESTATTACYPSRC
jgi:hypothetical protein